VFAFASLQRRAAWLFGGALLSGLLGFGWYFDRQLPAAPPHVSKHTLPASMARDVAPFRVRHLAHWAVESGDSAGLPFLVLDKSGARLFAFEASGRLRGSAPVLLGAAHGDSAVVPATPAGRFTTDPERQASAPGLVWTNASGELLLHDPHSRLLPGRASERFASDTTQDRRISDGSLHVPPAFFHVHLNVLRGGASVAYVLPEEQPVQRVFGSAPKPVAEDIGRSL
jgi:hypothetical protein